jgi:hypothetical protein
MNSRLKAGMQPIWEYDDPRSYAKRYSLRGWGSVAQTAMAEGSEATALWRCTSASGAHCVALLNSAHDPKRRRGQRQMRRDCSHLFPLISVLLLFPALSYGQAWSGILAPSRAIDWSHAGLPATFPDGETTPNPWTPPTRTQCGAALSPSGGDDTTQIMNAVSACGQGTYVLLNQGRFTIGTNLRLGGSYTSGHNYVTVRGSGPMRTTLVTSGAGINLGASANVNPVTLSASPAQGATSATLTSSSSTPTVGQVAWFEQCDDGQSGNPCNTGAHTDTNGLYFCGLDSGCQTDGGAPAVNNSYLQTQAVHITSVSGATIGFTPGLYLPNWSTARSARLRWNQSSYMGFGMGLEDLTVELSGGASVNLGSAYASWIKGVRLIGTPSGQSINIGNSTKNCLVANNYITARSPGPYHEMIQYSGDSDDLIVNNAMAGGFIEGGGHSSGIVLAYNYIRDTNSGGNPYGEFQHQAGSSFNLLEGNQMPSAKDDATWGTHNLNSFFRNYFPCWDSPFTTNNFSALLIDSYARFDNAIGNALGSLNRAGTPQCANYDNASGGFPYLFGLNAGGGLNRTSDPLARTSALRWGNYAVCTGDSHCNRVSWDSAENPTTLTGNAAAFNNLANPSTALPESLFMSGSTAPGWWTVCRSWTAFPTSCAQTQNQPFPAIGPDITGGLTENPHAYDIPAAVAWKTLPVDTNYQVSYGITTSSYSNGIETLGLSSPFPVTPMGGFQITGAGACNSPAGGEFLMTSSSTTTVSYALAADPGSCAGGTVKWPDIRQFDQRVYGSNSGGGTSPSAPKGLAAVVR